MPLRESHNRITNKITAAVYAKLQFTAPVNIYSLIDPHFPQTKIKMHTKSLPMHIQSSCHAAQDRFASLAFSPTMSSLTNTASRIPSPSMDLCVRTGHAENHTYSPHSTVIYSKHRRARRTITQSDPPWQCRPRICSRSHCMAYKKWKQNKVRYTMELIYTGRRHSQAR